MFMHTTPLLTTRTSSDRPPGRVQATVVFRSIPIRRRGPITGPWRRISRRGGRLTLPSGTRPRLSRSGTLPTVAIADRTVGRCDGGTPPCSQPLRHSPTEILRPARTWTSRPPRRRSRGRRQPSRFGPFRAVPPRNASTSVPPSLPSDRSYRPPLGGGPGSSPRFVSPITSRPTGRSVVSPRTGAVTRLPSREGPVVGLALRGHGPSGRTFLS